MQQPDWSQLPAELWCRIAVAARAGLRPVTLADLDYLKRPHVGERGQAWLAWWKLVACLGSCCRDLRHALFGPASSTLWRWTALQSPENSARYTGLPRRQLAGLTHMLLRQAAHAQSVLLLGQWSVQSRLQAVMAQLTGLQELALGDF